MDQQLYAYNPIAERPPLAWPGDARVAFYVGLNIEHYHVDMPSTSTAPATAMLAPDPMNYGWRDYGVRVGIWRMIELLDRLEITPSVLLNSDVCRHYPQIVQAGVERDWAWLAHGQSNSFFQAGMDVDAERAYLREMLDTLQEATGVLPHGWLGPAMTETFETPRLLAELGLSYVLDWCNDDQPYWLNVPGMMSVPYTVELNDISLFVGRNLDGEAYVRHVVDALDQLLEDAADGSGRVLALAVHPFVISQPTRHRYFAQALEQVRSREGVWVTTSDAIAAHYREQVPQEVSHG